MNTLDQELGRALKQAAAEVQEMPDSPEARVRVVAALQAAMRSFRRCRTVRRRRYGSRS